MAKITIEVTEQQAQYILQLFPDAIILKDINNTLTPIRKSVLSKWTRTKQYQRANLFRLSAEDNNELQALFHVGARQIRRIISDYRNMQPKNR